MDNNLETLYHLAEACCSQARSIIEMLDTATSIKKSEEMEKICRQARLAAYNLLGNISTFVAEAENEISQSKRKKASRGDSN